MTFVATLVVVIIVTVCLSVGTLLGRRPLRGSCGRGQETCVCRAEPGDSREECPNIDRAGSLT